MEHLIGHNMARLSVDSAVPYWTVQQFTTVAGRPWFALQLQSDGGVDRQYTGYFHEMKHLAAELGVTPQVRAPTTEEEFLTVCGAEQ